MDDWVFVDTCIWSAFFTKPNSPEKLAVDELIDADRVALAGPIVAEILLGIRRKDQADWIASRLRHAHYVETDWNAWRFAATLGRDLAANGRQLRRRTRATPHHPRLLDRSALRSGPRPETLPTLTRERTR